MKILQSIRIIYDSRVEDYKKIKNQVDAYISHNKLDTWHYYSRVKEPESFALKIESGRYSSVDEFDDFFAGTIVVENASSIKSAVEFLKEKFDFSHQKPMVDGETHKPSDSFPFDDLRLYLKLKDSDFVRPTGNTGLLFEIQIKTFLQHAWSIATHDLIYKADEKNWPKERIAYQIKAMLEHAEISISEADNLSKSPYNVKTDFKSKNINDVIGFLKRFWDDSELPTNVKSLASRIDSLRSDLNFTIDQLRDMMNEENRVNLGTKSRNLSPYAVIIQALFNQKKDDFIKCLSQKKRSREKIMIPTEVELPDGVNLKNLERAIQF